MKKQCHHGIFEQYLSSESIRNPNKKRMRERYLVIAGICPVQVKSMWYVIDVDWLNVKNVQVQNGLTYPLQGKSTNCVLWKCVQLQQCNLDVSIHLTVIRPVFTAFHLVNRDKLHLIKYAYKDSHRNVFDMCLTKQCYLLENYVTYCSAWNICKEGDTEQLYLNSAPTKSTSSSIDRGGNYIIVFNEGEHNI
jgi:hypothetical protein